MVFENAPAGGLTSTLGPIVTIWKDGRKDMGDTSVVTLIMLHSSRLSIYADEILLKLPSTAMESFLASLGGETATEYAASDVEA